MQERPLDFSAIFESAQKKLNFAMWVSFHLRNTALKFFWLGCSSFSKYYVCKQPSVFQAASFGDLLLNKKQRKPFVSLKDQVTITQSILTAASLAQVDNAPNGADSNLFCRDTRGFNSRLVKCSLFCSVFLLFSKTFFVSL